MFTTSRMWGKLKSIFTDSNAPKQNIQTEITDENLTDCITETQNARLEYSIETLEEVSFKIFLLNACKNKHGENSPIFVGEFFKFLYYLKTLTETEFDWEEKFDEILQSSTGDDLVNGQTVYEIFESNIGVILYSIGDNYGIMFDKYNITLDAYVTTELFSNGFELEPNMITFKDFITYFDSIY